MSNNSNDELDPNVIRERNKNPERRVAVLGIINDYGQIFLVRTTRLPNHWQPLGGGMEPEDKTPEDTIIRELGEETSLPIKVSDLKHEITTDYDFGVGKVYFYSARLSIPDDTWFSEREIVEKKWFKLEDALELEAFPATKKFLTHLINNR